MVDFIKQWIETNSLNVEWTSNRSFKLDGKDHLCIEAKKGKLFDENFNLIIDEYELNTPEAILIDYWCFSFGGKVYRSSCKEEKITLNLLKHIGQARDQSGFPYLGIHGGYELCVGSRNYTDWCQKAKWLGVKTVGVAEKHTLAGTLKFQQASKKAGLKSIIGATYTVKYNTIDYKVKLYVKNDIGWDNLLRIHKQLNVDNNSTHITEEHLLNHSEGLYCVFQNDTMLNPDLIERYLESNFEKYYFQFDPVEYKAEQRDLHCLNCLKTVLQDYAGIIDLILIPDSYYLDKEDHSVKKILNFIGKVGFEYQSEDQYFKSLEDIAIQSIALFNTKGEDKALEILQAALENTNEIADNCNFQIKTGEIHLPKYEMTNEEKEQFSSNEDLFWSIIQQGLERHVVNKGKDLDKYMQRVELEYEVISKGNFQDYFLILRDIIKWSESNDILVGSGRGCFYYRSKVLMHDGFTKQINKIKIGDRVLNYFNNSSVSVTNIFEYSVKEQLVKLYFDAKKSVITCTKDHKFFTINRGWVSADSLTNEDDVAQMFFIYKVTNKINGKVYIGKTTHLLEYRKYGHKNDVNRYFASKFYNAVKKYGFDNFTWELIETLNTNDEKELSSKEIGWIKFYNANNDSFGYNIHEGGNGGNNYKHHPNMKAVKEKISHGVKNNKRKNPRLTKKRRKEMSRIAREIMRSLTPEQLEERIIKCKETKTKNGTLNNNSQAYRASMNDPNVRLKIKSIQQKYWYVQLNEKNKLINVFASLTDIGYYFDNKCGTNVSIIINKYPHRKCFGFYWKRYSKNEIKKEEIYQLYREGL